MMVNDNIAVPQTEITAFCERWQVTELALFGSVLREDYRPESDIDMLVSFGEDAQHTLLDMGMMEAELKEILGRDVDIVGRRGVEASLNHLRRKRILESAEVIYGT